MRLLTKEDLVSSLPETTSVKSTSIPVSYPGITELYTPGEPNSFAARWYKPQDPSHYTLYYKWNFHNLKKNLTYVTWLTSLGTSRSFTSHHSIPPLMKVWNDLHIVASAHQITRISQRHVQILMGNPYVWDILKYFVHTSMHTPTVMWWTESITSTIYGNLSQYCAH